MGILDFFLIIGWLGFLSILFQKDLLLKIPGVNSKNIKAIMTKVPDLYHLCQMSEEELTEIIENSKNAKLIYEFFNKTIAEINPFDKELDFEDLNSFVDNEIKAAIASADVQGKNSKSKKGVIKQQVPSNKNLKKKTSSKRLT